MHQPEGYSKTFTISNSYQPSFWLPESNNKSLEYQQLLPLVS
jgi:hypothetical protein